MRRLREKYWHFGLDFVMYNDKAIRDIASNQLVDELMDTHKTVE